MQVPQRQWDPTFSQHSYRFRPGRSAHQVVAQRSGILWQAIAGWAKGVRIKTTMEELASYMRGWRGYFGFCETPEVLIALTRWVRLDSGQLCGGSGRHHVVAVRR